LLWAATVLQLVAQMSVGVANVQGPVGVVLRTLRLLSLDFDADVGGTDDGRIACIRTRKSPFKGHSWLFGVIAFGLTVWSAAVLVAARCRAARVLSRAQRVAHSLSVLLGLLVAQSSYRALDLVACLRDGRHVTTGEQCWSDRHVSIASFAITVAALHVLVWPLVMGWLVVRALTRAGWRRKVRRQPTAQKLLGHVNPMIATRGSSLGVIATPPPAVDVDALDWAARAPALKLFLADDYRPRAFAMLFVDWAVLVGIAVAQLVSRARENPVAKLVIVASLCSLAAIVFVRSRPYEAENAWRAPLRLLVLGLTAALAAVDFVTWQWPNSTAADGLGWAAFVGVVAAGTLFLAAIWAALLRGAWLEDLAATLLAATSRIDVDMSGAREALRALLARPSWGAGWAKVAATLRSNAKASATLGVNGASLGERLQRAARTPLFETLMTTLRTVRDRGCKRPRVESARGALDAAIATLPPPEPRAPHMLTSEHAWESFSTRSPEPVLPDLHAIAINARASLMQGSLRAVKRGTIATPQRGQRPSRASGAAASAT
jgi:hypothetical protein